MMGFVEHTHIIQQFIAAIKVIHGH